MAALATDVCVAPCYVGDDCWLIVTMTNDGINVSDDVFIGEDDDGDGDNQQSSNGILACKQ